jgi:hypothetical protein
MAGSSDEGRTLARQDALCIKYDRSDVVAPPARGRACARRQTMFRVKSARFRVS